MRLCQPMLSSGLASSVRLLILVLANLAVVPVVAGAVSYVVRPLAVPEGAALWATDLNDLGVVVGWSAEALDIGGIHSTGPAIPTLWITPEQRQVLGTLGGSEGQASAVNNYGLVVGAANRIDNRPHAFVYTAADGMQEVTAVGDFSHAYDVNDIGQMAVEEGFAGYLVQPDGATVNLGGFGTLPRASPRAINESGVIVGHAEWEAFRWTPDGGIENIGSLGVGGVALDVNEGGRIVGFSDTLAGERHAFSWTEGGGMIDLGTLGGEKSVAHGLNDAGNIVGFSFVAGGVHAFLWTEAEGMMDLNDLIVPSGEWEMTDARAINASGQIIGRGLREGRQYWVRLDLASLAVTIDIRPGRDSNSVNPSRRGAIPVAILTTEDFDALTVDADSVRFGPDGAEKWHRRAHPKDLDRDGDLDLLLHFPTRKTGIAPGDTQACLTGETLDGALIYACDVVRTARRSR